MTVIFKGSFAHKRIIEISKRMHAEPGTDFYGIVLNGNNVLYRRATAYFQPRGGKKYPRWNWKNPFGSQEDRSKVDYILLHGPEIGQADESFFLFRAKETWNLARIWPVLNLAADARNQPSASRDEIFKHQRTLREVIRTVS